MAWFELLDAAALPAGLGDVAEHMGPWTLSAGRAAHLASFTTSAADEVLPCWRIALDTDLARAQVVLEQGERSMAATEAQLAGVLDRLDRLHQIIRRGARHAAPGAGHEPGRASVPAAPGLPAAEASFLAELDQEVHARVVVEAPVPELVGFAGEAGGEAVAARVGAVLQSIHRLAFHAAWIETTSRGELLARSIMGWSGDTQIVVSRSLTHEHVRLVARSMAMALRSRHAWARVLAVVLQGSARIAAAGLTPAGMAAAVLLAWHFVRNVLAERARLQPAS